MLRCSKEAFAACPDRKNCGCIEEAIFAEGSECDEFNRKIGSHTLANADRIRAMSDEELADWIVCPHGNLCDSPGALDGDCPNCCLQWLQQPAEEDAL